MAKGVIMNKRTIYHIHTSRQLSEVVRFFIESNWIARGYYEEGDIKYLLNWMRMSDYRVVLSARVKAALYKGFNL